MINIDGTTPLPPDRLGEMVTAIYNADAGDECDWAEWKSTLDLSSKHGVFHTGRAILGFANRNPATSTQPFGGMAYVLVGVEPDQIAGVEPIDGSQLQSKVARYLGSPSPFWRHHYVQPVEASDKTVLVVEVRPPQPGDPGYPLATGYEPDEANQGDGKERASGQSGTMFIRRGSKTDRANYAEMTMLMNRACQRGSTMLPDLDLRTTAVSLSPLAVLDVSEAAIDWWLEQRRQVLLASLPTRALGRLRSDFGDAVDSYIEHCKPLAEGILVATFLYRGFNGITVDINNASDEHLPNTEAVLTLPAGCLVIDRDRLEPGRFPDPPSAISGQLDKLTTSRRQTAKVIASRHAIQVSDTKIRYTEDFGLIRPRSHTHSCTIQLLIDPGIEELEVEIAVTSTAFPGVVYNKTILPVETKDMAFLSEIIHPDPRIASQERDGIRYPLVHKH